MLLLIYKVIHAHGNHADGARDQFSRSAAPCTVTLHVFHFPVKTSFQPVLQVFLMVLQIDVTNAKLLETQFLSPLADLRQEIFRYLCQRVATMLGQVGIILP